MAEVYIDVAPQPLDLNTTSRVVWSVGKYLTGSFQLQAENFAAWTSATVTFKRSNDGQKFYSFPTAVTLSADGMTPNLDLSGAAFVAAEVTTANGAALTASVWGCFKT